MVGKCQADIPGIAGYVNSAQRRLLYCREAGNDGWWGTFAEMVFNVDPDLPYITTPRSVARIIYNNWCDEYVPVQNQFYEYLQFGNGSLPKRFVNSCVDIQQTYTRNNVVTFTDLSDTPQLIRIRITDSTDAGKRILLQGTDNNDLTIYTQDTLSRVIGVFYVLESPFVTSSYQFNSLTGIQKDVTNGVVNIYQVDPDTGAEVLLLTMEPSETTASYRRYYLGSLPRTCCLPSSSEDDGTVQVRAIVKLEMIPVVYDTDYCLLQNLEAIIEECQSIRYSEVDNPNSKQMSSNSHREAVRMLNGELNHYLGQEQPAVGFRPFGSAVLQRRKVGTLI